MNSFLKLSDSQRTLVIEQCSNKIGIPAQAVEKDMWVTVILQLLFDSDLKKNILFKGGTSLSKFGRLIERFSEDIDLAVNPALFGFDDYPTKKQLKKLRKASSLFVKKRLSSILQHQIERYNLNNWLTIEIESDGDGDHTYPEPRKLYVLYTSALPLTLDYIKPKVILETGARSLMEPVVNIHLESIIENLIPTIETSVCNPEVITADPEKTFVEKAFLLYELFSVERDYLSVERKSRHLYDLYVMMDKDFALKSITDDFLWESVRHHREVFTSMNGVNYNCDIRDNIKLTPSEKTSDNWKADYNLMCDAMIYGRKPNWDELISRLKVLERRFKERKILY